MKDMTVMEIEKVLGERVRATLEKGLTPEEQKRMFMKKASFFSASQVQEMN